MKRYYPSLAAGLAIIAAALLLPFAAASFSSAQENPAPLADPNAPPPVPTETAIDPTNMEILAQGPIHEAFAQPVVYNPEPGRIVPKAPPAPIQEVPAEQRPVGDNVEWIPGYWAWDEDRTDFLWVSGFWRVMPPNLTWVPGYWAEVPTGHQWISGFWADARNNEVTYLPEPPQSQEVGPSTAPPGANQFWVPGNWMWNNNNYAWRPGYWSTSYSNWMWSPARYVYTPRGYIFVNGFWDYNLANRGLLFAPVTFNQGFYGSGQSYMPRYALNTNLLTNFLFVNPYRRSYFFGNYYGNQYNQFGYQPWFNFANSRAGYDPLWASYRMRNGAAWETQMRNNYATLQQNEKARPATTFAAMQKANANGQLGANAFVQPLSKWNSNDLKLQKLDPAHRDIITRNSQHFHDFTKVRSQSELGVNAGAAANVNPGTPKANVNAGTQGKLRLDLPQGISVKSNNNVRTTLKPNDLNPGAINPRINTPNVDPRKIEPRINTPNVDPRKIEPKIDAPNLNPRNVEPRIRNPNLEPKVLPKVEPKIEPKNPVNPPRINLPMNPPKEIKLPNNPPREIKLPMGGNNNPGNDRGNDRNPRGNGGSGKKGRN